MGILDNLEAYIDLKDFIDIREDIDQIEEDSELF